MIIRKTLKFKTGEFIFEDELPKRIRFYLSFHIETIKDLKIVSIGDDLKVAFVEGHNHDGNEVTVVIRYTWAAFEMEII